MSKKVMAGIGSLLALGAALGLGALLLTTAADAQPKSAPSLSVVRPSPWRASYSVALEGERGQRLPTFAHQGKTFVLGALGERYAIRVINPTDERVEAVISVDGRDVLTGRHGDYIHTRGYLVPPHGSVRVEGFRQSLDDVAVFRFSDPPDSYSARMGTPENVGVIGVAFFPERRRAPAIAAPPARAARTPAPLAPRAAKSRARGEAAPESASADQYRLGTEYGETQQSPVREVPFERAQPSAPARIAVLHYDDRSGLQSRGIRVDPEFPWQPPPRRAPEPFPASRFAPPPP